MQSVDGKAMVSRQDYEKKKPYSVYKASFVSKITHANEIAPFLMLKQKLI